MTLPEIRQQYGSLKAACQWYGQELRMSKTATAAELGVPIATFCSWLTRFSLHSLFLPVEKQRGQSRGKGSLKPGSGNRDEIRLSRRKPIEHNGVVWYPGETFHHFLFEQRRGNAKSMGSSRG